MKTPIERPIMKSVAIPVTVVALVVACLLGTGPNLRPNLSGEPAKRENTEQLIFFAVLEGLYRDGVANDDVDIVLAKTKRKGGAEGYINFVYGCGLCTPALDAFRTYRARPEFYARKGAADNFGTGLSKAQRALLRSSEAQTRLDLLQSLIQRWTDQRLDQKRLQDPERTDYEHDLAERRKEAMTRLQENRRGGFSLFSGTDNCAVCDGSVKAAEK